MRSDLPLMVSRVFSLVIRSPFSDTNLIASSTTVAFVNKHFGYHETAGITEVTLRNRFKDLKDKLPQLNNYLD